MSDSEFVTLIVKIVFAVLSIVFTTYVIPFLSAITEKYKDSQFEKFVYDSVKAAEQVIKGDKTGPEKKAKVLKAASEWLKTHHVEMSEQEIDNLIESLVYTMNHIEEQSK